MAGIIYWIMDSFLFTLRLEYYLRGEAMYISLIDFQWYCTKRNGFEYRKTPSISRTKYQNLNVSRLAFVFAQSIEGRC